MVFTVLLGMNLSMFIFHDFLSELNGTLLLLGVNFNGTQGCVSILCSLLLRCHVDCNLQEFHLACILLLRSPVALPFYQKERIHVLYKLCIAHIAI